MLYILTQEIHHGSKLAILPAHSNEDQDNDRQYLGFDSHDAPESSTLKRPHEDTQEDERSLGSNQRRRLTMTPTATASAPDTVVSTPVPPPITTMPSTPTETEGTEGAPVPSQTLSGTVTSKGKETMGTVPNGTETKADSGHSDSGTESPEDEDDTVPRSPSVESVTNPIDLEACATEVTSKAKATTGTVPNRTETKVDSGHSDSGTESPEDEDDSVPRSPSVESMTYVIDMGTWAAEVYAGGYEYTQPHPWAETHIELDADKCSVCLYPFH